jgi:hypothetical protein
VAIGESLIARIQYQQRATFCFVLFGGSSEHQHVACVTASRKPDFVASIYATHFTHIVVQVMNNTGNAEHDPFAWQRNSPTAQSKQDISGSLAPHRVTCRTVAAARPPSDSIRCVTYSSLAHYKEQVCIMDSRGPVGCLLIDLATRVGGVIDCGPRPCRGPKPSFSRSRRGELNNAARRQVPVQRDRCLVDRPAVNSIWHFFAAGTAAAVIRSARRRHHQAVIRAGG